MKDNKANNINIQNIQEFDEFHSISSIFSTPEDVREFISEEMIPKMNEIILALKQLETRISMHNLKQK